jgi:predicted GTPase
MGQTKAGKSTVSRSALTSRTETHLSSIQLINSLVDDETKHRTVGHRMVSETSETSVVVVERAPSQYAALNHLLNDRRIVLVDTPGFNDTTMNDAVVLTSISQWLLASFVQPFFRTIVH